MNMICTSEIDMADSVAPSDIDAVLTNAHGPSALPITQYLKPLQAQKYL